MTVCITLSPVQRTHDGHMGQVVTIAEALSGRTLGRFELVTDRDGAIVYRALDGSPYPAGLGSTTVIPYAINAQQQRATRPARPILPAVA